MRIALLTTSYPMSDSDAAGHFVRAEAYVLAEAGHDVTVLAPAGPESRSESRLALVELPHWGLFGWPGALERIRSHPWCIAGLLPFARAAREAIRSRGPFDRLVAHWILPSFWPIARGYVWETNVVAHGSDVGLLERLPSSIQRKVCRALAVESVTVRCVSNQLAQRLANLANGLSVPLPSLIVEPAALELPTLPPRAILRAALGLGSENAVMIVGRVVKGKRVDVAIEVVLAAFSLLDSRRKLRIIVIGEGPEKPLLMRRYPNVQWLGRLGRLETLRYIRAADLVVSASLNEGAPTVVREARALGTPVVAAASGDLIDWARSDPNLIVCPDFSTPADGRAAIAISAVRRALEIARDNLAP